MALQVPLFCQIVKGVVPRHADDLVPALQRGIAAGDDQLLPAGEKDDDHIVGDVQLAQGAARVLEIVRQQHLSEGRVAPGDAEQMMDGVGLHLALDQVGDVVGA